MALTVLRLETLHCTKPPDRKHPKGSDKVYVAAVTKDEAESHYLQVLFGARQGTLQQRRWQHPSLRAAQDAWNDKIAEQRRDGYVSIDWTQSYYGLAVAVPGLGELALGLRPAGTPPPARPTPMPLPGRTSGFHEWRPIRPDPLRPTLIICATCRGFRPDPVHDVPSDADPAPAPQLASQARPEARQRREPPPPPPQPLQPPTRERKGRNIPFPR